MAAVTVNNSGACGNEWTSNFLYVQNKLNGSVRCTIVTIKTPKRNAQSETAQTRNRDFKRCTKIMVILIP
jgi:hypothetical protein